MPEEQVVGSGAAAAAPPDASAGAGAPPASPPSTPPAEPEFYEGSWSGGQFKVPYSKRNDYIGLGLLVEKQVGDDPSALQPRAEPREAPPEPKPEPASAQPDPMREALSRLERLEQKLQANEIKALTRDIEAEAIAAVQGSEILKRFSGDEEKAKAIRATILAMDSSKRNPDIKATAKYLDALIKGIVDSEKENYIRGKLEAAGRRPESSTGGSSPPKTKTSKMTLDSPELDDVLHEAYSSAIRDSLG